ncbi:unnamed protein product [Ilex paraguariensis]|uniref:Uncharacterized protein n=1 Tax=Ilex paraguariensis TaxID=185542 RepID=A0ABC8RUX6_9AQUA
MISQPYPFFSWFTISSYHTLRPHLDPNSLHGLKLLAKVEILGVSLPWRFIFVREGPGTMLCEQANNCQKETNPFLSSIDSNLASALSNDEELTRVQQYTTTSTWVDLLTGRKGFRGPFLSP